MREIIDREINNYITEDPEYFSLEEYQNLKQSFIVNANTEYLFFEIDSYVVVDNRVSREKLVSTIADIFCDNLSHFNQQVKENTMLSKSLEDYKKKLRRLDEKFTSEGIRENSVLHVDIVLLDLVGRMVTERGKFKVKFMFENSLFESRRFEARERNIQKFNFKVNSPRSELYLQLIGFNAIGSGKVELEELKDQKRSIKLVKLSNDEGEVVANLHLQMLWIHSFNALYSQKIALLNKDLEEGKEKEQKFSQKLESICSIVPGLRSQLATTQFGTFKSMKSFRFMKPQKAQYLSTALMVNIYVLLLTNLALALCFPNISELCLLLLFAILMYNETLVDNTWLVLVIATILIIKDVIVFLFYANVDYIAMLRQIDSGDTVVAVCKVILWVNLGFKVVFMGLYGTYNHQY